VKWLLLHRDRRYEVAETKPSVLVVDDDPSIIELVETTLREEGYTTSKATSIAEAVRVFEEGDFGLAVLDIYLPDGTGLELAARIREKNPRLPVIIMTGTPDSENISQSVSIEVDAYLIKPIEIENLISLVQELS
jgi:DNA-binding response OmpR family regulator